MDVQALVGTTGAGTAAGAAPAPVSSTVPAAAPAASDASQHVLGEPAKKAAGIAPAIAKLFGGSDDDVPKVPALSVSYKIENHEILTIFTDPATGQEIAQFPPDLLAHLSSFFDAPQGVTLDQNA
jgi:hypothetical protein